MRRTPASGRTADESTPGGGLGRSASAGAQQMRRTLAPRRTLASSRTMDESTPGTRSSTASTPGEAASAGPPRRSRSTPADADLLPLPPGVTGWSPRPGHSTRGGPGYGTTTRGGGGMMGASGFGGGFGGVGGMRV